MAQTFLTISLGTTSAKLAEVQKSGKKVQVFSAYDIPLSDGICEDGVILNVEALAEELKHYISMFKIKTKDLVFSITSKRIASKEVLIPYVKEKQIKGIVDINASEYFPVSNIENYAINYSILEIVKKDDSTQYRLSVTATPNELLSHYNLLAKEMKMKIAHIDYAGNAILQVLKSQINYGEVCAILQLGYDNTVINVLDGGVLIMQRSVSAGLNALIASVSESLTLDENRSIAFLEDNNIDKIAGAYPEVKYVLDSMITSITRIFDFYNGRYSEHPITSVKFIGDATFVNGIGPTLSNGLGMYAEELFTLKNVVVKNKRITPEFATNFMSNIGSVIAPMKLAYVSAEDSDAAKDEKLPWGLVVVSFVAAIVLLAATIIPYKTAEKEKKQLEGQYNSLKDMQDLEMRLSDATSKIGNIESFYNTTKGSGDSLSNLVTDLEQVMPKNMSIDTLSFSNGQVSLTVGGVGKESVARFIQELKNIPYINNVNVDYIAEMQDDIEIYDSFTMTFNLVEITDDENADGDGAEGVDVVETEELIDAVEVSELEGGEE